MANIPSDLLEEVGKARISGGGVYIEYGDYPALMVKTWKYQKIEDRCIILEVFFVESRKKVVQEGDKTIDQAPNQPGTTASTVANFDGEAKKSAPSNARAPVIALFGMDDSKVPAAKVTATLDEVIGDSQPAAGMILACSAYPKEIRSRKGSYITGLSWECVSPPGTGINTPDKVKARLAALAISPEECVKVATAQLAEFRAAQGSAITSGAAVGAIPVVATPAVVSAPAAAAAAAAAAAPAIPAAPSVPSIPSAPAQVDPMLGWTVHPTNPDYFYRADGTRASTYTKAEILAGNFSRG